MNKTLPLTIILMFLLSGFAFGQELDPNQPEQDACNALLICGNTFHTPYSYQGEGVVADLINTPCGGGEGNSVWLRLNVNTSGTIVFEIQPVSVFDDYDFAVVDISETTCDDFGFGDVVRCNFNSNNPGSTVDGIIGLSTTATPTFVGGGTFGSAYCSAIDAVAGESYLIMVNNFGNYVTGGASSGFTIDFSGSTATFNSAGVPLVDEVTFDCSQSDQISFTLNQEILCSSLSDDNTDYIIEPFGTIATISGTGCNAAGEGYTSEITITFDAPLPGGDYMIIPQAGSDGNSILNLCEEEQPYVDIINFTVPPLIKIDSITIDCLFIYLNLSTPVDTSSIASNGSDFTLTGPEGGLAIIGASTFESGEAVRTRKIRLRLDSPIPVVGDYHIISKTGTDGNTLIDSCNREMSVSDTFTFTVNAVTPKLTLPDSLITCFADSILLPLEVEFFEGVTNSFIWTPTAGLSSSSIQQPMTLPTSDLMYRVQVISDAPAACPVTDSIFVHVIPDFEFITNDTTICRGDFVAVVTAGSDEYNYQWSPASEGVETPNNRTTVIIPGNTTTYTLTASHAGCADNAKEITINVELAPIVTLDIDSTYLCNRDTLIIQSNVTPGDVSYPYSYDWYPNSTYEDLGLPHVVFYGDTSLVLYLDVTTPAGCKGVDSAIITVAQPLITQLNHNEVFLCLNDTVHLEVLGGATYEWTPTNGLSDPNSPNPILTVTENQIYQLEVIGEDGCKNYEKLIVHLNPAAVVNLPDTVVMYAGEKYEIDLTSNASYFSWFPADGLSNPFIGNPIAAPLVRTRYFVTATTEQGCSFIDSVDILVNDYEFDLPNVFVPNGKNPVFKPEFRGNVQLNKFEVYNRWGNKVFETSDINQGWDGTFNGSPQPTGTYIYVIDAKMASGKQLSTSGDISLIR